MSLFFLKKIKNATVVSDSEFIAQDLGYLLDTNIPTIPILSTVRANNVKKNEFGSKSKLQICYLGAPREEKGFCFLADFLIAKISDFDENGIQFVIQINKDETLSRREQLAVQRIQLLANNVNNLKLLYGPLSSELYSHLLSEFDIMLLPYISDRYKKCTSGLLSDALYFGMIPVVTKGTWLEHTITKLNYGFSFEKLDIDLFYSAIINAVNYRMLCKETTSIVNKWDTLNDEEKIKKFL